MMKLKKALKTSLALAMLMEVVLTLPGCSPIKKDERLSCLLSDHLQTPHEHRQNRQGY